MAIKLVDRMHKVEGVTYPPGSLGARGIYSVDLSYKGLGFTKEEATEWLAYGLCAQMAMELKLKGLSVMAIKMAGPPYEEFLRGYANGEPLGRMYLSELGDRLRTEAMGVREDNDDWGFDTETGKDNVQYTGKTPVEKKSRPRSSKKSSIESVSALSDSVSESRSTRRKSSKKTLMLRSKNS